MASYQDLDVRVAVIEDMLDFVMTAMRMKAVVSSGVVGLDGEPIPTKAIDASLKQLYYLSRQLPYTDQATTEPPPIVTE